MSRQRASGGFSLIGAIFILVIMSSAGSFMLSLAGSSRQTQNLVLLQARADAAARSGLEWGIRKIVVSPATCPAATFSLAESTLSGFDVTVTCTDSTHDENGLSTKVFRLVSKAERGAFGDPDYVSRTMTVTLTD